MAIELERDLFDLVELLDDIYYLTAEESEPHACCGTCPCAEVGPLVSEIAEIAQHLNERFILVDRSLWERVRGAQARVSTAEARVHRLSRVIRPSLRRAVLARDGGLCRYCGTDPGPHPQLDHYEPDGPDDMDNLVTACQPCNRRKSNTRPADLLTLKLMTLLPVPETAAAGSPPKDHLTACSPPPTPNNPSV